MKTVLAITACIILVGCAPPPVPKETHAKQVKQAIAMAGGETNILAESRTLFTRLSHRKDSAPFYDTNDPPLQSLSGITTLGDVFYYSQNEPDRIHVRIHNSHFDTYFVELLNPDLPEPVGFGRIVGNVGFIEPSGASNGSQPIRSETNRRPSAAGSRR